MTKLNFKYLVKGDHPIFMKVDRKCLMLDEAINVKNGLDAIGYNVKIKKIIKKGKKEIKS